MPPTSPVRLRAITPIHVGEAELSRRQARYDTIAPPGLSIHVSDLPDSSEVPRRLDEAAAIAAADAAVVAAAARTDPAEFDLVMPDCVLDSGLDRLREERLELPVVGVTELAAHGVVSVGGRFAAVTRNDAIGEELTRRITAYGLAEHFAGVHVLGLGFDAISDDAAWNAAIDDVVARVGQGVRTILNGCSAVDVRSRAGVTVFDPTRTALALLAIAHRDGLVPPAAEAMS